MEQLLRADPIIKTQKQKKIICSRIPTELHKTIQMELYKFNSVFKEGAMLSIIKQIIKKNQQKKHINLVTYDHICFQSSKVFNQKIFNPVYYVAMVRYDQPLIKIKWKLMNIKQKLKNMVCLAKAVKQLHKNQRFGLSLAKNDIFMGKNKQIKIGNIFKSEIYWLQNNAQLRLPFENWNVKKKKQFDIWSLAVIFIEVLINGRLVIDWKDPEYTLKSIKTFLKYSDHVIFFSISSIISRMIRFDDKQISLEKVVKRLNRISKLREEDIARNELPIKEMVISLVPLSTNQLRGNYQILPQNQRILIIGDFQIFLTLSPDGKELTLELIRPENSDPLIATTYTYHNLPTRIRRKYNNIAALFYFLQSLDHRCFVLTQQGALLIRSD